MITRRDAFWLPCMWEWWFSFAIDGLLLKCLGLALKCGPVYICMGQVKRKWLKLSIIWFTVLHLKLTFSINQAAHEGASSAFHPGRAPTFPFGTLGWGTLLGELMGEELKHWGGLVFPLHLYEVEGQKPSQGNCVTRKLWGNIADPPGSADRIPSRREDRTGINTRAALQSEANILACWKRQGSVLTFFFSRWFRF